MKKIIILFLLLILSFNVFAENKTENVLSDVKIAENVLFSNDKYYLTDDYGIKAIFTISLADTGSIYSKELKSKDSEIVLKFNKIKGYDKLDFDVKSKSDFSIKLCNEYLRHDVVFDPIEEHKKENDCYIYERSGNIVIDPAWNTTPFTTYGKFYLIPENNSNVTRYYNINGESNLTNKYFSFNGVNGYFDIDSKFYLNNFSINMMVNFDSTNNNEVILDSGYFASAKSVLMQFTSSNKIFFATRDSGTVNIYTSNTSFSTNKWYFLSFVGNSSHIMLYVDGVLDSIGVNNNVNFTTNLINFGRRYNDPTSSFYYDGLMYNLQIHKTLNQTKINELNSTNVILTNESTLLSYLSMSQLNDFSGENNNFYAYNGISSVNRYYDIDGTDDFLENPTINISNQGTIMYWINFDVISTEKHIFETSNHYTHSHISNTAFEFNVFNGTHELMLESNTNPTINTWYHVVNTWNDTSSDFYIDGVLDSELNYSGNIQSDIGLKISNSTNAFNGKIKGISYSNVKYPDYVIKYIYDQGRDYIFDYYTIQNPVFDELYINPTDVYDNDDSYVFLKVSDGHPYYTVTCNATVNGLLVKQDSKIVNNNTLTNFTTLDKAYYIPDDVLNVTCIASNLFSGSSVASYQITILDSATEPPTTSFDSDEIRNIRQVLMYFFLGFMWIVLICVGIIFKNYGMFFLGMIFGIMLGAGIIANNPSNFVLGIGMIFTSLVMWIGSHKLANWK